MVDSSDCGVIEAACVDAQRAAAFAGFHSKSLIHPILTPVIQTGRATPAPVAVHATELELARRNAELLGDRGAHEPSRWSAEPAATHAASTQAHHVPRPVSGTRDVDARSCGLFWQAGHGEDRAAESHHITGAGRATK